MNTQDYTTAVDRYIPETYKSEMMTDEAHETFEDGRRLVMSALSRAATDVAFRETLTESPKEALKAQYEAVNGRPFPLDEFPVDIRFVEPVGDVTVVLPAFEDPEAELSEADLEAVAGGAGPIAVAVAGAIALSNVGCLAFGAGVATVAVIAWAAN